MYAVQDHSGPPLDDPEGIGTSSAIGLDRALLCRMGRFRFKYRSTQIVDNASGQLPDVLPRRNGSRQSVWFAQ